MKRSFYVWLSILCVLFFSFYGYLYFRYDTPILMYHSIDSSRVNSYAAVSPENFEKQIQFIKQKGYFVLSMSEYCRALIEKKKLPRNSVVITFDDGFKNNTLAADILKKYDMPATIFVIVNELGKEESLSQADLRHIIQNTDIEIGSHTLNGLYLPGLENQALTKEIIDSKKALETLFGVAVPTFSYSIGGFDERCLTLVKDAGYSCACTTNRGYSKKRDRYALRRIKVTDRDLGFRLWAKLSGFYNVFRTPKNPN
ncbi:MAG: polysaccharide deacetylase family protein [Candidatus Omnitrophica bacterium]|nr:polysaccharide deacetylase family protein [Candidatus Omnitrophota bacterium]